MCSHSSHSFTKVLKTGWWVWGRGGCLGGLTIPLCGVDQTLTFSLAPAFNFLAHVASQRERGGFY